MRMLPGLGSPWTTHRSCPLSRAHAARHRATPSAGIAPRSIFVPVSACRRSVEDRQPGRCGQPCVNRCSWRSVSATRRQSASVSGDSPSTCVITTSPSAKCRPSVVGSGTGTVSPSRSRCRNSSVSHARSASLRLPSRPTASCPLTRTLHTSLTPTPPVSGSMRATSSPHWSSASQPTATSSRRVMKRATAMRHARVCSRLNAARRMRRGSSRRRRCRSSTRRSG